MGIVLLIKKIDYLISYGLHISIANKCSFEQMLREHLILRTNVGDQMTGYPKFGCKIP